MNYKIKRTNSTDLNFQKLVVELDKDLSIKDGEEHSFFAQYNKIDAIKHVVLIYENEIAVGCGAIKTYDKNTMEVKRMFVAINKRGKGIASMILKELESWTIDLGYKKCILETGKKQIEAIGLYKKNKYTLIPNYGQYKSIASSVCFEKEIEH